MTDPVRDGRASRTCGAPWRSSQGHDETQIRRLMAEQETAMRARDAERLVSR